MSFRYFLNFEKIAIQIIENEINKMTDCNVLLQQVGDHEEQVNEKVFVENLKHGAVVVTFIVNLYETTLNTILGRRLNFNDEDFLRLSSSVKLKLICKEYNVDFDEIKSNDDFGSIKEIIKVRNDITHYKMNDLGCGSAVYKTIQFPIGKSKKLLPVLFTKSNIQKYYDSLIKFLRYFCEKCGLQINKNCEVIDCDGCHSECEFVTVKTN